MPSKHDDRTRSHRFGGDWTEQKLGVLAGYLKSYTTALQDKPSPSRPFRKGYIDAFAGTGYWDPQGSSGAPGATALPLFPDLAEPEPQELLDGSARLALRTDPPFDRYVFIDRSPARCSALEALKDEFPSLAARIDVQKGDANLKIQELCQRDWSSHRAVLFLDPYGMQVQWATIDAVAKTQAIDLWLLFPLGIGVNRLLTKSGDIPASWRQALTELLGTEAWYDALYTKETTQTLFGENEERVVKAKMQDIGQYFTARLATAFPGVAKQPGVLRNSVNNPLYLLCFAAGNKRGSQVALRIANHLLRELN